MGLIEIVLAGLCLNTTGFCPGDELDKTLTLKQQRFQELLEELKHEHFVITTMKNGVLSGAETQNGTLRLSGISSQLMDIFQKKFGFTYEIKLPRKNEFGTGNEGILNLLMSKKADIAIAFLPILDQYRSNITFSPSLDTGEWVVLLKRPKESATGSGLLAPFTTPVWILIILSLLFVGPIIYLIIYARDKLCKDDLNQVYSLSSCMWFVYGALLKQGTTLNPVSDSARLLFSTWWIFITILTAFYTANLTAFLTLSKFTLPIYSPEDIAKKHYRWVTNEGNALKDSLFVESSPNLNVTRDLIPTIGRPFSYLNLEDEQILDGYVTKRNMMFIRERPVVDYVMYEEYKRKTKSGTPESERCTFVITKFSVISYPRAIAYRKDFKYSEIFDSAIQHLVESGIIKFKLREKLPDTEICPLNLGNTERRLTNSDLIMTYMIVGAGLAISALVFVVEFLVEKFSFKKNSSRNNLDGNERVKIMDQPIQFITPPPPYHELFRPPKVTHDEIVLRKMVNGRDYWVVQSDKGRSKLIPTRTPSALLFQYTN